MSADLAAISHRFTAADTDLTVFAALNAVRVLDVLSSTPARPNSRSPCENSHFRALASRIGEILRLVITSGVVVGAAWAARKVLGPTLDAMGGDLVSYYRIGVNRILASAYRKTKDVEDGKSANLRVAHDVLQNGAFCADEFVSEYLGGLLASSRSNDGWIVGLSRVGRLEQAG